MTALRTSLLAFAALSSGTSALGRDPLHPTVVELYQSQGCSSCPPAIANVNALAGRSDILALTFAVTYWDQLGWKDSFAKPEFTDRQWAYAHAHQHPNVATPQAIIDGRRFTNGGDLKQLVATIKAADRGASGPAIRSAPGAVTIGNNPVAAAATVWLVRYDPRPLAVPIRAGENGGRTLVHRNVVKSLTMLGAWRGQSMRYALPASPTPPLRSAVLVQQGKGGPILAASRI